MSQWSRYLPVSLGLLCAGTVAFGALTARSQTPPATTTPAASGEASAAPSGSAAASASGSAQAASGPPTVRGADIPKERSDPPKDKKDWDPAKIVSPNSGTGGACIFKVLREWLRIECETRIAGALIAGETTDVKVWSWGDPFVPLGGEEAKLRGQMPQTIIVMPLQRGESKIFDLRRIDGGGWDWVGPARAEMISITWRDGSDDPYILVR